MSKLILLSLPVLLSSLVGVADAGGNAGGLRGCKERLAQGHAELESVKAKLEKAYAELATAKSAQQTKLEVGEYEFEFEVSGGVLHMVATKGASKGLVGKWSFDDVHAQDTSSFRMTGAPNGFGVAYTNYRFDFSFEGDQLSVTPRRLYKKAYPKVPKPEEKARIIF